MTQAKHRPKDDIIIRHFMSWPKFKKLQEAFSETPGCRLSYYQGEVEILTVSPEHGRIAELLTFLLSLWMLDQGINCTPGGDSTIQKEGGPSAEGDKSYWFNDRDPELEPTPDLAIEVVISGEGITKLRRYRELGVPEVWFWQNNKIHMYNPLESVEDEIYESQFIKGIDLTLLAQCSTAKTLMDARKCFTDGAASY